MQVTFLLGLTYFLIGRLFALPVTHAQAWRIAAWLVSGILYAAHISYLHFKLRSPPRRIAWHAALAVALGAFALAAAGAIHSLASSSSIRPLWLLALVLWPLITAVPAGLIALAAGWLLAQVTGPIPEGRT